MNPPRSWRKYSTSSPFRSDRDFDSAGKLAKAARDTGARSAAGAAGIGGIETGRLQSRQVESNLRGADQSANTRLTDNRFAKADALKSADKPSASALGQFAAPAPSSPAAKSSLADAEEKAKERNENPDSTVKGKSEMQDYGATSVAAAQAAPGRAKDEADKKVRKAVNGGAKEVPSVARSADDLGALTKSRQAGPCRPKVCCSVLSIPARPGRQFRWRITSRSTPSPQTIPTSGLGEQQARSIIPPMAASFGLKSPVADGKPLTANIISVEFTDAQHGKLITDDHET
jgi:hypothetical protein